MSLEELEQLKALINKAMDCGICTQPSDVAILRNTKQLVSYFISKKN